MQKLVETYLSKDGKQNCIVACKEECQNNGISSCYCKPIMDVRLKLVEYESTGLTPWEANELAEWRKGKKGVEEYLEAAYGWNQAKHENAGLCAQLTASEHRERSMVEYLKEYNVCYLCAHDAKCSSNNPRRRIKKVSGYCDNWEWRGVIG